jgi:hypothetical protein
MSCSRSVAFSSLKAEIETKCLIFLQNVIKFLRKAKLTFFKLEEGDNLGVLFVIWQLERIWQFLNDWFLFLCRV